MTLNITILSNRYILQISDRRLVRISNGDVEIYTDDANKASLFSGRDAGLTITFHGLGYFGSPKQRTDEWLAKTLSDQRQSQTPTEEVLNEFTHIASRHLKKLIKRHPKSINDLRHTFVLTGFTPEPTILLISNYEDLVNHERLETPRESFLITSYKLTVNTDEAAAIWYGGDFKSLRDNDRKLLFCLAQKPGAKPQDVLNVAIKTLQNGAKISKYIGEKCNSTFQIPNKPSIDCKYHSPGEKDIYYLPNYIHDFTMTQIKVQTGERAREDMDKHNKNKTNK